jgi:phage shock protein A
MNLFIRTRKLVTANVNDWMDRLERPEQLARQSLRDLEQVIEAATSATARSIVAERLLQRQRDRCAEETAGWKRRAADALQAGDEPLARQSLAQAYRANQLVQRTAGRLTQAAEVNRKLREQLDRLRERYRLARDQLTVDTARLNAATAMRQFQTTLGSTASPSLGDVDRELGRVERAALEAEATVELNGDPSDELAGDLRRRGEERFIREELEKLRRQG